MYILVRLLNGFPSSLWYSVPPSLQQQVITNGIVQVPLRTTVIPAFVINHTYTKPSHVSFALKDIIGVETIPDDVYYFSFLQKVGMYYQQEPITFIKRIHQFLAHKQEEDIVAPVEPPLASINNNTLTPEQQIVYEFVTQKITNPAYTPTVIHGITGSGKTEIYKQLFIDALAHNKTALFLLPEVTLARSFEQRLAQELPHLPLHGFHSGKTPKEKKLVWNNLKNNVPMIIIGVHLPALLPISNLGLIIVDEEHETGYQEKKHPKINSKEAALIRAQNNGIPIVLGSATPSLQTLHNVKTKQWAFFQLKKRFSGTLPTVQLVSLTTNKKRKQFWISKELERAIQDRLNKKEQTIIFINRRGMSFFVQCKSCSFIFDCSSCSVSLTLHEDDMLRCHYCDKSNQLPPQCPECKTNDLLKKGIGTQKITALLQKMFPHARVERADLDITTKKKVWQQTVTDMLNGSIDILVGTQTITKGFHFPGVTLVGVLWADLQLNFPVYNAAEAALQQLIQVSGRAGRETTSSLVIIQTMKEHDIFSYIEEKNYLSFYAAEIEHRQELGYPPCKRFVEIELKNKNPMKLDKEADDIVTLLHTYAQNSTSQLTVLGPCHPPIAKIKDIHSRKIYLKSESFSTIVEAFKLIDHLNYSSAVYFTPTPL